MLNLVVRTVPGRFYKVKERVQL